MTDEVQTKAPVVNVIEILQLEFPDKVKTNLGQETFRTVAFVLGENGVTRISAGDTQYVVMCVDNTGIAFPTASVRSASFKLCTFEEASAKVTAMVAKAAETEAAVTEEVEAPSSGNVVDLAKARKTKK